MPTHNRYPPGVNPYAPSTSSKTPSSSSSTNSAYKGHRANLPPRPNVHPPKVLLDDVDIENFHPPEWRTVLNSRVDLGYPDFYPSRPGFDQPEDVLTEDNVKNGFSGRNFIAVGAEVFSMHGPIHNHLSSGGLNLLQNLGKELIEKRQEMMPKIGERAFRIPVRVTYNDTKRLQFLNDLANPKVPLHRLMKTPVPHGFKGIELLDSMFSPTFGPSSTSSSAHGRAASGNASTKMPSDPIPIDRALWFIRVLGSNEISAHRSRTQPQIQHQTNPNTPGGVSAPSPAANVATPSSTTTVANTPTLPVSSNDWYTQEFTNTFISWLRIQLGHLSLPNTSKSTAKPGVPPQKVTTGVLGDEKFRAKWLLKWDYSTQLMRELHRRQLLSTRLLSGWLADFLIIANFAQLGFLAQLIGEYLQDMNKHTCNARHCVRNACEQLEEIRLSPGSSSLGQVEAMLTSIIKSLCEANTNVLLSPITWKPHSDLLATIVPNAVVAVKERNEALLFKMNRDESSSSPRRQQMAEIQKLDSICEDTNMLELTRSFFDGMSSANNTSPDLTRLEEKILILLNWAMGLFQLGSHRPYAVYTILKHWHNQHEEHQSKQAKPHVIDLFPILYKWLDTSSAAQKEENIQAIGITIGELTRGGMFSYGRYLQTLIAKGQTARTQAPNQQPSHHLALLRAMPIFVEAKDLMHQRRIALCGDDIASRAIDEAEEAALTEQFRDEVKEFVPEVSGYSDAALRDVIDYQVPCSAKMSRYLYVQARFWLAPGAGIYLRGDDGKSPMNSSTFSRILQVFRTCRGYATIADFIMRALQDSDDIEILDVIIDTVRRDADVWTAMDGWSRLSDKLLDRYHTLQTQGKEHMRTLEFLEHLVGKGRLTADEEDEVKHLRSELPTASPRNVPAKLEFKESHHGLQQVLSAAKEENATTLAPKLFVRHGSFSNWSGSWWNTIIEVLQHPSSHLSHDAVLRTVVSHVVAVCKQAETHLESTVTEWLEKLAPAALVDMFGKRAGGLITHFLLELVVHRYLPTLTLLDHLVYPVWKYTSAIILTPRRRLTVKQIQAVVNTINVFSQLLVSPPLSSTLPPSNPIDSLIVLASRQAVFCGTSVQSLIRHLPLLVVLQTSALLSENTNFIISSSLRCLAMTAEFKTAAFRNLSVLKDAFLSTEWSKSSSCHGLEAGMEDTLKLIMSEKPPNMSTPAQKSRLSTFDNTARFSAWKWTRIVLEMRSDFKGLATRIAKGEDVVEARQTLNRQVLATLDRATTADDTDLLCEAFRGMDGVVTQEILVAGIDRLSNLLSQAIGAETQHHLEESIKGMEQILRILDNTYGQSAQTVTDHTVLTARHKLLDLTTVALQSVERQISDNDPNLHQDISPPQAGDLLKIIMNLLRFILGLMVIDVNSPTIPKPNFANLAVSFFKVMISGPQTFDVPLSKTMSDMLAYIIDSAPSQSRLACQTALLAETNSVAVQDVLSDLSILSQSLPHLSPVKRSMALLGPDSTNLESSGDDQVLDSALIMDDRKWELFEQMNPLPKQPLHQDLYLVNRPVKDNSSISLSLFNPKITRDALPNMGHKWSTEEEDIIVDEEVKEEGEAIDDDKQKSSKVQAEKDEQVEEESRPWEDYASERVLGDDLNESYYLKQSSTLLFDGSDELINGSNGIPHSSDSSIHEVDDHEDVKSPQIKNKRRMSTRSLDKPTKISPIKKGAENKKGIGSGSNKDPISIDEDSDNSDDNSSEEEKPLAIKKQRTTSTSISNNRKSSTSGKAPATSTQARKTTGGKTVGRKNTGGKSVRGTGGKAPRGRRKSQAD